MIRPSALKRQKPCLLIWGYPKALCAVWQDCKNRYALSLFCTKLELMRKKWIRKKARSGDFAIVKLCELQREQLSKVCAADVLGCGEALCID